MNMREIASAGDVLFFQCEQGELTKCQHAAALDRLIDQVSPLDMKCRRYIDVVLMPRLKELKQEPEPLLS